MAISTAQGNMSNHLRLLGHLEYLMKLRLFTNLV